MATAHVMRSPSGGVSDIEEGEEAKGIAWKRAEDNFPLKRKIKSEKRRKTNWSNKQHKDRGEK